jgi:PilZ domain-containing protein
MAESRRIRLGKDLAKRYRFRAQSRVPGKRGDMKPRGTSSVSNSVMNLNKDYAVGPVDAGARFAERRCVPRYPFVAKAEMSDPVSRTSASGSTTEISTRGCYIETLAPMPRNSVIKIRIVHGDSAFETWGRVAYSHDGRGMGIAFLETAPDQQKIIDSWVAEFGGV